MLALLISAAMGLAPLPPGTHEIAVRHDGLDRSYLVTVPSEAREGRRFPVVLNFHGGGSDAAAQRRYTRMDELAQREGFVAVYPNGTGTFSHFLTWNAGTCCGYAQASPPAGTQRVRRRRSCATAAAAPRRRSCSGN